MKKAVRLISVTAIMFSTFAIGTINAQDNRRVRPAFPINSGEKMMVIPGSEFTSGLGGLPVFSFISGADADSIFYHINLPVGTKLKRMVVEAADNDGGDTSYIVFKLIRVRNSDLSGDWIVLREITTQGYNSNQFTQLISNPMNHSMLQGWTYHAEIIAQGGLSSSHKIGVIKIIYEP